jgi:hypothetical protein
VRDFTAPAWPGGPPAKREQHECALGSLPHHSLQTDPLPAAALRADLQALAMMARELSARAGPAPTGGIDPSLPAGQLAMVLWAACGRRKCMWLRTRLCQLAEREDGQRVRGRGRDRITG